MPARCRVCIAGFYSLRHSQENATASVACTRVRVIDSLWLLSSFMRQTQSRQVSSKLGQFGHLLKLYVNCWHTLCVCVGVCDFICISPFICGWGVASCSVNGVLHERLCHWHFTHHTEPNLTTWPGPDILCRKLLTIFWWIYLCYLCL